MFFARDNSGFSIIEVTIAAGMLGLSMLAISTIFSHLESAKNSTVDRATQIQLQSQATQLLGSPTDCVKNLVDHTLAPGSTSKITFLNTQTFDLYEKGAPGAVAIFQSGSVYQGSKFDITIENPVFIQSVNAGTEHPVATKRYSADIIISKKVQNLNTNLGPAYSKASIPIFIETDVSGNLQYCTTRPENIEDSLYSPGVGNAHSIRDCYKVGGVPYPSALGLICRVPIPRMNTISGYKTVQPLLTCPASWTLAKIGGIPLSTTIVRDLNFKPSQCPLAPAKCKTAWHSMNNINPATEWCAASGDGSGASTNQSDLLLGATVAGFSAYAIAATNPVGWAFLAFFAVLAIFGGSGDSCVPPPIYYQYSQPIAVGCY